MPHHRASIEVYASSLFFLLLMVLGLGACQAQVPVACLGDQDSGSTYSIAIVPQRPAAQIHSDWSPLLDAIGKAENICFRLSTYATIPEFEASLLDGVPDFAYMNPYHLVMAHSRQGYVPLLKDTRKLTGVLVVAKDDPVNSLSGIFGKTVAFPAPNAFAASLLLRASLARAGIQVKAIYLKNHSNVYRAVVIGDARAGGGVNNTLSQEPPGLRDQLRILYETAPFASHPLAANPRVPERVREEVIARILSLHAEPVNSGMFRGTIPDPEPASYVLDYAPLQALGLEDFVVGHRE